MYFKLSFIMFPFFNYFVKNFALGAVWFSTLTGMMDWIGAFHHRDDVVSSFLCMSTVPTGWPPGPTAICDGAGFMEPGGIR